MHEECLEQLHVWPSARWPVRRFQRYPQYSDTELEPFFAEVYAGYCFNQAADRCLYERRFVWNTIYSDDEVMEHALNLSMAAGALIRSGKMPIPDRYDGLYSP
jgi:hypothetical protein